MPGTCVLFVLVAVSVVCLGLSVSQKVLLHCEGVRQRSNEKGDEIEAHKVSHHLGPSWRNLAEISAWSV